MLDPTSVVRESEYARSAEGTALMSRIQGAYEKLIQGGAGVTVEDLKTFKDMSLKLMENYQLDMVDAAERIEYNAAKNGLDMGTILTPNTQELLQDVRKEQYINRKFTKPPTSAPTGHFWVRDMETGDDVVVSMEEYNQNAVWDPYSEMELGRFRLLPQTEL